MKRLDMTGVPCPIPVVQARKAMAAGAGAVEVLVDNAIAVQNLEKMAAGEGYAIQTETLSESSFRVVLTGQGNPGGMPQKQPEKPARPAQVDAAGFPSPQAGMTVLVTKEWMGEGAQELGMLLMKGFLFALTELATPPERVVFLNGGAKLTTQGANTVPDLLALAEKGTEIYTCGTCANFYGIKDALAVGQLTDMMHIATMLQKAGRVVTL